MYAIGYIVLGVPITSGLLRQIKDLEYKDLPEMHDELDPSDTPEVIEEIVIERFFETVYHGSAPSYVGWCGVHLGGFDECSEELKVSSLMKQPTPAQQQEMQQKLADLPAAIRAIIPNPDLYIVWGSS